MKKFIIYLLSVTSIIVLISSCEDMFGDYLEKAPGADVTEDTIFSSQAQVELFLAACYEQALYDPLEETKYRYGDVQTANDITENLSFFTSICDEGEHEAPWWRGNKINIGSLTSANNWFDNFFKYRFTGIRMVNTLIERVDEVPDASDVYKMQLKAEARHLRAELHFIFFKKYGGISLVGRRFGPSETAEMKIPRSSVDSTVQFIVNDLDFAIANLPDSYSSNMRGRIT
ncbi:MAG: RagB/SusD family nutrient uptake outer membrane protein, partial [Draconibacterium sp.]|nr:RagB/SusD family nutrient uptake outer membrane protein [Draconibacterium sp.]